MRTMTSGENHCMAWPRLRIGMSVLGFGENCPLVQEPAKARGVAAAHLVQPRAPTIQKEDLIPKLAQPAAGMLVPAAVTLDAV